MRLYQLYEAITSRVFHYTRAGTAAKILSSGEFELSSTLGASWEQQFAPKGYPYFLSTTRTRFGGYHQSVGSDAVLFTLDGNFYNQRYPGRAVDYWNNRNPLQSHHREHEAEDRIFSRDPAIPAAITKMDVYVSIDAEPATLARIRKIALLAKQRGIPVGLYTDADAWRLGDERKQVDVSILRGQEPSRRNYPSRRYLKRWIELISANKKSQLSKEADSIRYNLMYTYDKESAAKSLDTDLSNARKPDSSDRPDAVKIIRYMQANKLANVKDFVNHLATKWKNMVNEKIDRTDSNELIIFDIDDTLLHTNAKINVVNNGKVITSLTNQEFNNYQLKPGEEFDFGEFRDARKFEEESVPIGPMLDQLRQDLSAGKNVVMLTARADFDNQKAVWRTFKRHGIDINKDVHLFRAGNLSAGGSPAEKKAIHVTKWLKTGKFDRVVMYDDSERNLMVFNTLKKHFPDVDFEAHHVSDQGQTSRMESGSASR